MKSLIKKTLLKPLWKATLPVRRPIGNRFEAYLRRCMPAPPANNDLAETIVVLDHAVRELVRLQDQVDLLRDAIEDMRQEVQSGSSTSQPRLSAPAA